MMYEIDNNKEMLDILNERVSNISDCMVALTKEGFIPNKNKTTILNWSSILIDAYQNFQIFNDEQKAKINDLFEKVTNL